MSGDFDFLFGSWRVVHRRLKTRLSGQNDWQEFGGSCVCQPILGGLGNVDDNVIGLPEGAYRAATLRAFDRATQAWSIWWLDGRFARRIDVPLVGRFEGVFGTFHAEDQYGGRSIRVRFIWSRETAAEPKWEQAFSADAGQSWETNWIMRFRRIP
jgi:hypothetical protein